MSLSAVLLCASLASCITIQVPLCYDVGCNRCVSQVDEGITIVRRKKDVTSQMARNFLEDEAELSGDDVGSDDDDDDNGGW